MPFLVELFRLLESRAGLAGSVIGDCRGRCPRLGAVGMDGEGVLDPLAKGVLARYPYRFIVARDEAERRIAYQLRYEAVVAAGWADAASLPDGVECDEFDDVAIQVVGWLDDEPVCTGRLVLPPGPLPSELACGIVVQPAGQVVDVGRMAVGAAHRSREHAAFVALLCRLYLEMRDSGFDVACGMMSPTVRGLLRRLGLTLETLGTDRMYWGERRCPVRFGVTVGALSVLHQWAGQDEAGVYPAEAE